MKRIGLFATFVLFVFISQGQSLVQTIRGEIIDLDSKSELIGATIALLSDSTIVQGVSTDEVGKFKIENVSIGRHTLKFSYLGYKDVFRTVVLTSGKEAYLQVEMEEDAFLMEGIEVVATQKGQVQNDMAIISARSFEVEETDRYAGSRGDPARMAANFAGVQGGDDSRNDIVVRGNSPLGTSYRLEGVEIPNPSHFAISGTTGGAVSIINNKTLRNSDFYTGAFPAEFGNSTSSVFDLKLRSGNEEKKEYTGQFGMFGLELMAEGPLSKKKNSSFLIGYRYSTVTIFQAMGIDLGTSSEPFYHDGIFNFKFRGKKGGVVNIFGIGGASTVDLLISNQKDTSEVDLYGENDRDQYFKTQFGIVGVSYKKNISPSAYFKSTTAYTYERQSSRHDYLDRSVEGDQFIVNDKYALMGFDYKIGRWQNSSTITIKKNARNTIKAGINVSLFEYDLIDTVLFPQHKLDVGNFIKWRTRSDEKESTMMFRSFAQWKHKLSERMTMNVGIHNQYFELSNSFSAFEPRVGLKYRISANQELSVGFGVHSQTMPFYLYAYQPEQEDGSRSPAYLKEIDFSKSNHYVVAYSNQISKKLRMKWEVYYQDLYNIPVEVTPSHFSMINQGSKSYRFFPNELENTGTGKNYGIELTLEKFFSDGYFFLLTGSIYESLYKGSDGIERESDYNGKHAMSVLGGKQFKLNETSHFTLGSNFTYAGGKKYGFPDVAKSEYEAALFFLDEGYNTRKYKDYLKLDVQLKYVFNKKKASHEIAIDLINLTNRANELSISYSPDFRGNLIKIKQQLEFLPVFYYRILF